MTIIKINSIIKWPNTINGPAKNPFFTESETVTVSIGPGTKAPDNPTPKEVRTNKISSNILSHFNLYYIFFIGIKNIEITMSLTVIFGPSRKLIVSIDFQYIKDFDPRYWGIYFNKSLGN